MENIEVKELNDKKIKFSTSCSFEVCISGSRYEELQMIAEDQQITESEALERVIREGFDC